MHDFSLRLTDHLVFGEATLALCFSLLPQPNYYKRLGQVLVVSGRRRGEGWRRETRKRWGVDDVRRIREEEGSNGGGGGRRGGDVGEKSK